MFNLIVTCVGGKNYEGPSIREAINNVLGREIRNDAETLFSEWKSIINRFIKNPCALCSAQHLYKGAMWSASLEAFNEIVGNKKLWIISCGFGLISSEDKISGYKVTFKPRQQDSVYTEEYFTTTDRRTVVRKWWDLLTSEGILGGVQHPRSIHELFDKSRKDDVFLIASGSDYYEAIFNDLAQIKMSSESPKLVLVGIRRTNSKFEPEVPEHLQPYVKSYSNNGKLQQFLNKNYRCSLIQVHPKSALHLIRSYNETGNLNLEFP